MRALRLRIDKILNTEIQDERGNDRSLTAK